MTTSKLSYIKYSIRTGLSRICCFDNVRNEKEWVGVIHFNEIRRGVDENELKT